jgi:hypothetical protein
VTAQPLTRIVCDRCEETIEIPIANTPVQARSSGPEGWQTMTIGADPSTPPTHLCPPCAADFKAFMVVGAERPHS